MMNKIIGAAVLLLCFCSCVKDNDAIYYPVGNVDIEKGGPALEVGSNSILGLRAIMKRIMYWIRLRSIRVIRLLAS